MSVRVWQEALPMKTYLRGPDNPNPAFDRTGSWTIYPYTMEDDLTETSANVEYAALCMENEYLKVIVLPELGGHLYSCYDKTAKRELFYRNNVVKPGLVACRGAWISGGVEFNFPQGHTMTTVDPVDYDLGETNEGVTVTVGNIDRVSRMQWAVSLSLHPGEAKVRQKTTLYNRTPIKQRHYFWSNSAVPATDDLHLVYPIRKALSGWGITDYPIQDGMDRSWYKNHPWANDIFSLDAEEDFFGCYYVDSDYGMVNAGDTKLACGKKFFTWGTGDDGLIWATILSDDDGPYVEIQSGRYVDQSTWECLFPHQAFSWEECWYPLHGMGSFVWANGEVAINYEPANGGAALAALSTSAIPGAQFIITDGDSLLWESKPFDLAPDKPAKLAVPASMNLPAEVSVTLANHLDEEVLTYIHPATYTKLPSVKITGEDKRPEPKAEDQCVPEELCVRATDQVRAKEVPRARELYEKALKLDAGYSKAHIGLGLLDFQAGLYQAARDHFQAALDRDREEDEALYHLGLAEIALSNHDAAKRALWKAANRQYCSAPAKYLLNVIAAREEDAPADYDYTDKGNVLIAAMARRAGFPGFELPETDSNIISHLNRAEAWLTAAESGDAGEAEIAWKDLVNGSRGEPQTWLEVACDYIEWGMHDDAFVLLTHGMDQIEAVRVHPEALYYIGYVATVLGEDEAAAQALEMAAAMPPAYCFPSRLESIEVLNTALEHNPNDARAMYYLGNLLAAKYRTDEALELWQKAVALWPGFAVLHNNIGSVLRARNDVAGAIAAFEQARACNPHDCHYYLDLERLYEKRGDESQARLALYENAPDDVQAKWQMASRMADLKVQCKDFDGALELLSAHRYFPWEGATGMRSIYLGALLGRAEAAEAESRTADALADYEAAMQYPRNLGVGKFNHPTDARIYLLAADAAAKLGLADKEKQYLMVAAEEPHRGIGEADVYKARALARLNRTAEAETLRAAIKAEADNRLTTKSDDEAAKAMLKLLEG